MSAVKTLKRRFAVGRHTATVAVTLVGGKAISADVVWGRHGPPLLTTPELARYRRLRNAVLMDVASEIQAPILVGDFEPDGSLLTTVLTP